MPTTQTTDWVQPDATVSWPRPASIADRLVQWATANSRAAAEHYLHTGMDESWEDVDASSESRRLALHERVASLADLPDDWDGHGAERISAKALHLASRFVESMPGSLLVIEPYPEPDGGVGFEHHADKRFSLYVSFSPSGEAAYVAVFRRDGGKEEVHRGSGIAKVMQLVTMINRILENAVIVG